MLYPQRKGEVISLGFLQDFFRLSGQFTSPAAQLSQPGLLEFWQQKVRDPQHSILPSLQSLPVYYSSFPVFICGASPGPGERRDRFHNLLSNRTVSCCPA